MNRRRFLGALGSALAAPAASRRVYSFLWDNPLVREPTAEELRALIKSTALYQKLTSENPILESAFDVPLFGAAAYALGRQL